MVGYCEMLIEQCDKWLGATDYEYKETLWGEKGVARKRGEQSDQK